MRFWGYLLLPQGGQGRSQPGPGLCRGSKMSWGVPGVVWVEEGRDSSV